MRAAAVVLLFLAVPVSAELAKYKAWADSPEAYFLSKGEREKWAAVDSDAAAETFIEAYRAARGKGFAAAIKSRIDLAERTYTRGKPKGARSPLGRTLVLLGSPTSFDRVRTTKDKTKVDISGSDAVSSPGAGRGGGAGSVSNPLSNVGGPGPNSMRGLQASEPALIRWVYQKPNLPPGAGAEEFTVEFLEDATGSVTFEDPARAEEVFQKVIAHWAPKAK